MFGLFGGAPPSKEPSQDPANNKIQAKSAVDLIQGGAGNLASKHKDDDYDFEDIEVIRERAGLKHRPRRAVGHTWGEIAVGTAQLCATSGVFGSVMGLCVGAITGPIMAPAGHRVPVTIALMKRQAIWFGVMFGFGGGVFEVGLGDWGKKGRIGRECSVRPDDHLMGYISPWACNRKVQIRRRAGV